MLFDRSNSPCSLRCLQFIKFRSHHEKPKPLVVEPLPHLLIQRRRPVPNVNDEHNQAELIPVAQITLRQASPRRHFFSGNLGVSVSWQVYEAERPVDPVEVDRLRASGRSARPRELFAVQRPACLRPPPAADQQCIEQTRFPYVAPSDKGDLGQTFARKLTWSHGAENEFDRHRPAPLAADRSRRALPAPGPDRSRNEGASSPASSPLSPPAARPSRTPSEIQAPPSILRSVAPGQSSALRPYS